MLDPMNPEQEVDAIKTLLDSYKSGHTNAKVEAYRQNSGSIRVRIIDPDFRFLDKALRHDQIWDLLGTLPEDIQSQVTVLLLLTPEEVKTSFANMDFENPVRSGL